MSNDENVQVENEYTKSYSEKSLIDKIKNFAKSAGIGVIYTVLLLYYVLKRVSTPLWAKNIIYGSLGYFILPIDAIPDFTPVVGYLDDFGVLMLALVTVACCIDDEVKEKARVKLKDWFGDYDKSSLVDIDNKINKKKQEEGNDEPK